MEKKILVSTFLLVVLSINFISAFGVSSPYWGGHPLEISQGDTKVVVLTLQNMVGDEDVTVEATLESGSEIASVKEGRYTIPAKTKDTEVPVTISIPEGVPLNETYSVKVSFQTVDSGKGGAVALSTAVGTSFDVIVANVPKSNQGNNKLIIILLVLGVLVVLGIIIYLLRNKIFNRS